jgi:hypothetical protein
VHRSRDPERRHQGRLGCGLLREVPRAVVAGVCLAQQHLRGAESGRGANPDGVEDPRLGCQVTGRGGAHQGAPEDADRQPHFAGISTSLFGSQVRINNIII